VAHSVTAEIINVSGNNC